jgi:hypothetical protein
MHRCEIALRYVVATFARFSIMHPWLKTIAFRWHNGNEAKVGRQPTSLVTLVGFLQQRWFRPQH